MAKPKKPLPPLEYHDALPSSPSPQSAPAGSEGKGSGVRSKPAPQPGEEGYPMGHTTADRRSSTEDKIARSMLRMGYPPDAKPISFVVKSDKTVVYIAPDGRKFAIIDTSLPGTPSKEGKDKA